LGTTIGVLVIPGLYYMFGRMADGKKLLQDETHEPLSESLERGGSKTSRDPHADEEDWDADEFDDEDA